MTARNPTPFGTLADGRLTTCFTLESPNARVRITDFGARMVAIETPDRAGNFGHILLGFETAEAYLEAGGSFGAILGRYANRIAHGRFTLGGTTTQLATNDPGGTLHGGPEGFANKLWQCKSFDAASNQLILTLTSPDGDQGFPGTLTAQVTYRLTANRLAIELEATTDQPTIINLSAHPYFNFAGSGDCLAHQITINAAHFLPTDATQIPTGEISPVAGTVFDFRTPKTLGADINKADPQLLIAHGYDHCFVLGGTGPAATVHHPASGRCMKLFTDEPGLQLYSGNSLDGSIIGRANKTFRQSAGFALEAQNFPDAPNHPNFPNATLHPADTYRRHIVYEASVVP